MTGANGIAIEADIFDHADGVWNTPSPSYFMTPSP